MEYESNSRNQQLYGRFPLLTGLSKVQESAFHLLDWKGEKISK